MELAAAREPTEAIEDVVARHDLTRVVEKAMANLPEEQRTAIILKEYHGLTFQEIADLVGLPAEHGEDAVVSGSRGPAPRAWSRGTQ